MQQPGQQPYLVKLVTNAGTPMRVPAPTAAQRTPVAGSQAMQRQIGIPSGPGTQTHSYRTMLDNQAQIVSLKKLQELLLQVDSRERLDSEVEELLVEIADDFVENVTSFAANLAKHRGSDILEVKDLQLHLERNWNIRIPGYGLKEDGPAKTIRKSSQTEAHRQRLSLVRKSLPRATGTRGAPIQ